MSSRYFWAWVTAWIGLVMATPSSGALKVIIDGQPHTGNTVTISEVSGGGTTTPPPGDPGGNTNNPPPDNQGGGNTPPPTDGSACSAGLKLYQTGLPNGSQQYTFGRGAAYAFSFQLSPGQRRLISFETSNSRGNGYHEKLATISACPGDFNLNNIPSACIRKGANAGGIYVDGGGASRAFYCTLKPNQTYYYNIRNYNALTGQDPCGTNETCGFTLTSH